MMNNLLFCLDDYSATSIATNRTIQIAGVKNFHSKNICPALATAINAAFDRATRSRENLAGLNQKTHIKSLQKSLRANHFADRRISGNLKLARHE